MQQDSEPSDEEMIRSLGDDWEGPGTEEDRDDERVEAYGPYELLSPPPAPLETPNDLYWEAVNRLVDGIESEIVTGGLHAQYDCINQLTRNVELGEWAIDPSLAIQILQHSKHPSAANEAPRRRTKQPFDFSHYARAAMRMDCVDELKRRQAFQKLPY